MSLKRRLRRQKGGRAVEQSQYKAIQFVRRAAQKKSTDAWSALKAICDRSNRPYRLIEDVIKTMMNEGQIALHFHPDRVLESGQTIAASLRLSGLYSNQFVTHNSNGMLAPYADSPRTRWEDHLFGPAYVGADLKFRPKYGALNVMGHPYGPAPRFGSCYFLLSSRCTNHATFCFGDSSADPSAKGTSEAFEDVLAALLKDSFVNEQVMGFIGIRPPELMDYLAGKHPSDSGALTSAAPVPNLNQYIEAQVHGDVRLDEDVVALVVDPSFKGSAVGEELAKMSVQYGFPLRWHLGYGLQVEEVVDDFRGRHMSNVARLIQQNGCINAAIIGQALADAAMNASDWANLEAPPENLLKFLWHVLVRFGGEWSEY